MTRKYYRSWFTIIRLTWASAHKHARAVPPPAVADRTVSPRRGTRRGKGTSAVSINLVRAYTAHEHVAGASPPTLFETYAFICCLSHARR